MVNFDPDPFDFLQRKNRVGVLLLFLLLFKQSGRPSRVALEQIHPGVGGLGDGPAKRGLLISS
jgi:hypothetical protein